MEKLLKAIGVADDVVEHLDKAVLAFQRPAVLWIGFLLLIPVSYFIYRRQRDNLVSVPRGFRIALTATRTFILAMMIIILAGPLLKIEERITRRPIVGVIFDTSQSMELPAGPFADDKELTSLAQATGLPLDDGKLSNDDRDKITAISRSQLAQDVFRTARDELVEKLGDDFEVRYYQAGRTTQPVTYETSATLSSNGLQFSASHLGESIHQVMEDAAGQRVAGMLLLSDGQNTGGRSPNQAARLAREAGAPIFSAAFGSRTRVKDVSIVDVYTSGLVAVGDHVQVHVSLQSQGFEGRKFQVLLKDGNEVLDKKEITIRDSESMQVELGFEAKRAGPRALTVEVPPAPEELPQLKANNTDAAFVRISDERLKLLLIDGLPRWDFRFLKNAARRDNGLGGREGDIADVVVETEWRRLPAAQQTAMLPQNVEEAAVYHTIIIGDVSPKLLTPKLQQILIEAVREKGVGLIVAAGPHAMPHLYGDDLVELLPVRMRDGKAKGRHAEAYKPFRLGLAPAGSIHETMRLYDDSGRNQTVWTGMPPYYWCADAERPAAGATVLAWNSSVEGRFGKMPLIAHHFAGDGRVMFVGTDSTWLWRQNVGDRYFYKFWGQAIRFVARKDEGDDKKSSITVRPVRALPGEEAEIELMAFHSDGSPQTGDTQTVTIVGPESRQTVELLRDKKHDGRYTGKVIPDKPGLHRLTYQAFEGAETINASVQVLSPQEYRYPNANRAVLESLAAASGGAVIEPSEVVRIAEHLKGETEQRDRRREAPLWDNWLVLLILVLVYSTDVGIRRLIGLS